jgi:hypothetical protein
MVPVNEKWSAKIVNAVTATELARLTAADPEDLRNFIAQNLQFDGRKRILHADSEVADIAAAHLPDHLVDSGYDVLQKPISPSHSAPDYSVSWRKL